MRNTTERKIKELSLFYISNRYRFMLLGGLLQLSRVLSFENESTLRDKRDNFLKTEEAEDIFDNLLDHIEDGALTTYQIDQTFELKNLEESAFDFFYYGVKFVNNFFLFSLSCIICFITLPIIDLLYNGMNAIYGIEKSIGFVSVVAILYVVFIIIFLKFRKNIENALLNIGEEK